MKQPTPEVTDAVPSVDECKALCSALTPAEREVLVLAACGLSNKWIARRKGHALKSIEAVRTRMFRRLDVVNIARAAAIAAKAGLV